MKDLKNTFMASASVAGLLTLAMTLSASAIPAPPEKVPETLSSGAALAAAFALLVVVRKIMSK